VKVEPPEVEHHHHRTGRPWLDLVLGVSAVSISFISLFLAIANGRAMERLVQANSWPFLQITYATLEADGTPHIHLDIANKGVGPARIETLEVAYNGTSLSGPQAMLNAMLNRASAPLHPRVQTSEVVHSVLAAKEQMPFVAFNPQEFSAEDYSAIRAGVQQLQFLACYCSVFDECWMTDTSKTRPSKVKQCPASHNPFQSG
jgi:hypothetical protein